MPDYFKSFPILRNSTIHNHSTRNQKIFHKKVITHEFAKKTLRNTLINTLNNCPDRILDKVHTHSQWGFTNYAKKYFINEYTLTCLLQIALYVNKVKIYKKKIHDTIILYLL